MVDLNDISVSADRDVTLAKKIFRQEGVLVVKRLLPLEVTNLVEGFLRDALRALDEVFGRYGLSTTDIGDAPRLAELLDRSGSSLPDKDKHIFLGHFPLEVRLSAPLREIPKFLNTHPLLFEILETSRLYSHMPPTARFVLPHCATARVPPHQDVSYNKHMGGEFCVAWVPLVPIDLDCGGMAAYPRTHHREEVLDAEFGSASAAGWLRPIEKSDIGNAERVVLGPLEPGDVVLLGDRTIHESMPNNSDRVRLSCDFRFFGKHSHSDKHYLDIASGTVIAPAA
jgi:hypothetical protein